MNSGRLNNLTLKYQELTSTICKDIGIIKFGLVANQLFMRVSMPEFQIRMHFV